jgi:D-sedoheptulose 7-phosphate isomerase
MNRARSDAPPDTGSLPFCDDFLRATAEIAHRTSRAEVAAVVDVLFAAYRGGHTIFTAGNGGSAANASHLAADLAKFTWAPGKPRFRVQSLCDNAALLSALTNDVGFDRLFVEQLEPFAKAGDVLICLSVHGGKGRDQAGAWSQNLVQAAELVQNRGGKVVAFVGYDGGLLGERCDARLLVPSAEDGTTSTPHVEGLHVVYHHLICERLRQLVAASET